MSARATVITIGDSQADRVPEGILLRLKERVIIGTYDTFEEAMASVQKKS
jgi:hypothetical protein